MTSLPVVRIEAHNPGPMTGAGNHTYLVSGAGGAAVLVDAGVGRPEHLEALAGALAAEHARLSAVVVTHAHPDHADGAAAVAQQHPQASFWKFPWPEEDRRFGVAWRRADDGTEIPIGSRDRLTVLHTPGHSPDHIVLWHEPSRTVFTGDLVELGRSVMIHASGGGRLSEYLASLERVRALAPVRLLPAHGPAIEDAGAVLAGHLAHRLERERQVLAALRSGRTSVRAIAESIYHGLPPALLAAAHENVLAHLEKLRDEGRARWENDRWTP